MALAGMHHWSTVTAAPPRQGAPERRIPVVGMDVDGGDNPDRLRK